MKKKVAIQAMNALAMLYDTSERQLSEALDDLKTVKYAHLVMRDEWERVYREAEHLRAVVERIANYNLNEASPAIACTFQRWVEEALERCDCS